MMPCSLEWANKIRCFADAVWCTMRYILSQESKSGAASTSFTWLFDLKMKKRFCDE
jgi:hypothetical protein